MPVTSYSSLLAALPLVRYPSNPIIRSQTGDWKDQQVFDPVILEDPLDSSRLIMFASGVGPGGPPWSVMGIGKFHGTKADPFTWSEVDPATGQNNNPLLWPQNGTWEYGTREAPGIRLGSVVKDGSTYYLFYHGGDYYGNKVGVATSTDCRTWTRYASNPMMVPQNNPFGNTLLDETHLENPAVIKVGSTWYMYYTYRIRADLNKLRGPRIATASSPFGPWARITGASDFVNAIDYGDPWDSVQTEWHQVFQLGTDYVMVYECYNGVDYRIAVASATNPAGPWTKYDSNPIFTKSNVSGTWDKNHVATAATYFINDVPYLYYCAAGDEVSHYTLSKWHIGVATFSGSPPPRQLASAGSSGGAGSLTASGVAVVNGGVLLAGRGATGSKNNLSTTVTTQAPFTGQGAEGDAGTVENLRKMEGFSIVSSLTGKTFLLFDKSDRNLFLGRT